MSTNLVELTDGTVFDAIAEGKPLMVDCWASWCHSCSLMAPAVEKIANEFAGQVTVGTYNLDDESELASRFHVMSLPTVLFFKDGKEIPSLRLTGVVLAQSLRSRVNQLLLL